MANARGWRVGSTASKSKTSQSAVNAEDIAQVAYELYQQRDCEDGHDLEDWLKAEAIVRQRQR